jgi:hypothetical protein
MRILVFPGDENTAIQALLNYPSPGEDHAR